MPFGLRLAGDLVWSGNLIDFLEAVLLCRVLLCRVLPESGIVVLGSTSFTVTFRLPALVRDVVTVVLELTVYDFLLGGARGFVFGFEMCDFVRGLVITCPASTTSVLDP